MRIIHGLKVSPPVAETILTIGILDGIHRGHQYLLRQLVQRARDTGRLSAALTFHPHPRAVLQPESSPRYLSSPEERATLLGEMGVDLMVQLPFTPELAATSAADLIRELIGALRMAELWVGAGFCMGRGREGDTDRLRALSAELGYTLRVIEPLLDDGEPISSTRIRNLLMSGRVREAERLLGRPYTLGGTVAAGAHRGRTLGFHTANLPVDPDRALPRDGVYAVWVMMADGRRGGVANIGVRPTFDSDDSRGDRLLEVHVFDYAGNLYGRRMAVEFVEWLRPELRFNSPAELVAQIARDVAEARALLGMPEGWRDGGG
jgi:riboflavin kinase/FMN adenylyltransferase